MGRSPERFVFTSLSGICVVLALAGLVWAQQDGDAEFEPPVLQPAWPPGTGPRVAVDEGHFNFHTATERYAPLARLLAADGYQVGVHEGAFRDDALAAVDILVVSNGLAARNTEDWSLPTPSAFTRPEIKAVRRWVAAGGALLLIADHMPFPGGAGALAGLFGARFTNGYVFAGDRRTPLVFTRDGGGLVEHPITSGAGAEQGVSAVATFTGSAFRPHRKLAPILILPTDAYSLETRVAGEFDDTTPRREVGGWWQGAVGEVGKGRVAIFAEAAMFTAQRSGEEQRPMGMNHPEATQNARFILDLVNWLARRDQPVAVSEP